MDGTGRAIRGLCLGALLVSVGAAAGYTHAERERTTDASLSFDALLDTLTVVDPQPADLRGEAMLPPEPEAEPAEDAPIHNVRFFKELKDRDFSGSYQALSRLSDNGDFVLLIETNAQRRPISDTLLAWVQHHGPDKPLSMQAAWADIVISCYPELLSDADRMHHVLPEAKGKVWLYFLNDRHLVVSDQRDPALDFALRGF